MDFETLRKELLVSHGEAAHRFFSRVSPKGDTECWEWSGPVDRDGYGKFKTRGRTRGAHRIILEWVSGTSGPCACHACDNPPCVNPRHLGWGTHKENQQDMVRKGRGRGGGANGRAKLSEEDVRLIRASLASNRDLAKKFRVAPTTISAIRHRKIWPHV